jgi:hypothetical protein
VHNQQHNHCSTKPLSACLNPVLCLACVICTAPGGRAVAWFASACPKTESHKKAKNI